MPTEEIQKITFKKLIMTIGNLPSSYVESLSYYECMLWLCNYLENTVVPAVNNNGEAVEELQQLFVELKTYVDTYFDDLNLQEEVNSKLDEMASDGTLTTLISNYVDPLFDDLSDDVEQQLSNFSESKMAELRKEYYGDYHIFQFPESINDFLKTITIYESYDKKNYTYALPELKVSTAATYYVDVTNGNDSNNGTSEATPWKTLKAALSQIDSDSTVYIKKGIYYRDSMPNNTTYNKVKYNMNIICEEGTIMGMFDNLAYTQNVTYSNIYQTTRSNAQHCIDIRNPEKLAMLPWVNSLELCANTPYSWTNEGATVYVNLNGEAVTSDKIVLSLNIEFNGINVDCTSQNKNLTLYLENATCISGKVPFLNVTSATSYQATLYTKKCKFMFKLQSDNTHDGLELRGANSILIDTQVSYNGKDGFNYHSANEKVCNAIEINCIGSYNGLKSGDNFANGSTMHDGGQIIRINGNYFNNHGGNVTDVQENTKSFNFQCNAFDSLSSWPNQKADFDVQQAGTNMYLYNCYCRYSNSNYGLYCEDGGNLYVSNTEYSTSHGTITPIN